MFTYAPQRQRLPVTARRISSSVGFAFERPVGPGPVRLHVAFQGKMPEKEVAGLFRPDLLVEVDAVVALPE